jgi:hypothetical protein
VLGIKTGDAQVLGTTKGAVGIVTIDVAGIAITFDDGIGAIWLVGMNVGTFSYEMTTTFGEL